MKNENVDKVLEKNSTKNIFGGAFVGYLLFFVNILSGLIVVPWIISAIGDSNYGIYTLSNSLISLFLLDFGLGATTSALLSKYNAKKDKEGAEKLISLIFKVYFVIDLIIALAFFVVFFQISNIYSGLTPLEKEKLKIAFAITSVFSVISFPASTLTGIISASEKFVALKIIEIIQKTIYISLSIISIVLGWGLYGLVIVNSIAGLITILIRFVYVKKKLHIKLFKKSRINSSDLKMVLSFSAWSAVVAICSRLIFNLTPSILGITSNTTQVAIFGVVATIEGYVYTFSSVLGGFFMPKIARIFEFDEEKRRDVFQKLAEKIGLIESVMICLIVLGLFVCGNDFINVWIRNSGSTYSPVIFCVLIICIYQLINVPQIVLNNAMYVMGKVKYLAISSIVKAVINCALAFVLSYKWGAVGASFAICISRIIELFLNNIFYKKNLDFSLHLFFEHSILKPVFIATILAIVFNRIKTMIVLDNKVLSILLVAFSVVVSYSALVYFFSLTESQKSFIGTRIKKLFLFRKK